MREPNPEDNCRIKDIKVKDCYYNQINGEKHQRKEKEPLCTHCYKIENKSQ